MLAGTGLALTSAVAGCLSQLTGDGNDDTGNDDDTGNESDGQDGGNDDDLDGTHYELTATEQPENSPLDHEVRLVQPRIDSPDGPLTLEVTLTNTGTTRISYGEQRSALALHDRDGEFVWHPPSERPQFDEATELWFVPEPVAITMEFRVGELEPGASHTQRLELIYDGEELPGSVPDEFDFDLTYGVIEGEGVPEQEGGFDWGFTLGRVE